MMGRGSYRRRVSGQRSARTFHLSIAVPCLVAILASGPLSIAVLANDNWVTTVAPGADKVRTAAAEPKEPVPSEPQKAALPVASTPSVPANAPASAPAPATAAKPASATRPSAGSVPAPAPSQAKSHADKAHQPAPSVGSPQADLDEPDGETARQYCRVVLDRATRERLTSESEATEALKKEIDDRLAKLKAAITEHEQWLKRRQDFQKKAQDGLVKVYASMAAEAAALRLGATDETIAAAILSMLAPKAASAVLSEMPPDKAARLTANLAGAAAIRAEDAKPEKGARP